MGERRIRQAAEIDDVGALGAQGFGASENRLEARSAKRRRSRRRCAARGATNRAPRRPCRRNAGRSFNSSGPRWNGAPNSCARRARSARQRPGTIDAIGVDRARQPAHEDGFGHQRRDLDADVEDRPVERRRLHALQDLLEAALERGGRSKTECAPSCRDFASSLRDRFAKLGDRVDRRHAGETSQALAILQIDRARIDLHHSFRRFGLKFGRRVAGEDNGRDAAFAAPGRRRW